MHVGTPNKDINFIGPMYTVMASKSLKIIGNVSLKPKHAAC